MTTATKYKTYSKYKSSGIGWLGDIPEGWEVKRLKNIIEPLQSGGRESESINLDGGVLSIGGEHVGWNGEILLENPRYISREYYLQMNQGKIKENDVLLVKDGATIGKTALIDKSFSEDAAVNEHVFIIRANNKNTPKYLYYFIISKIGQEQIFLEMRGSAQPGLNSGFISKSFLFTPPKDEQNKITDFLDRETAKIDEMVTKKQKLMVLLKEKRQALITHAVTKGLDPKAKMKPSGIDWLGDIPAGWEVKRLKYISQFNYGEALKDEDRISDGDFEVYGSNGIIGNHNLAITKNNTIVVGRKGSYGKITWVKQSCFPVDTTFFIDETATSNNLRWIYYLLLCIKLDEGNQDSAVPGLSREKAYNIFTPFMPIKTQQSIATYLDRETEKIDEVVAKVGSQIEKLQEFRQALITSAVTGKIRVN